MNLAIQHIVVLILRHKKRVSFLTPFLKYLLDIS